MYFKEYITLFQIKAVKKKFQEKCHLPNNYEHLEWRSLTFQPSYLLTWNFWAWVGFSALYGNCWLFHQSRGSTEKPLGVCILFFTAPHGNRIWCHPHLKSSFPHPSQGSLGEKHFPPMLLLYLSSWSRLQVCFQNTAGCNSHHLEAGISVQFAKVCIYIKMCLPSFAGLEGQGNGRALPHQCYGGRPG